MPDAADVPVLVDAVREIAGPSWADAPVGWPGEIEAALIDAVMSIRATYGGPQTGVRAAVARWREHRGDDPLDDLSRLAEADPETVAAVLRNRQRLAGNRLKAAGIVEAASRLAALGVRGADDLRARSTPHREAVTGVVGLGALTWGYLTLLLDVAAEPADPRVTAFVGDALGRPVTPADAQGLLRAAASEIGTAPVAVTHAVWREVRRR